MLRLFRAAVLALMMVPKVETAQDLQAALPSNARLRPPTPGGGAPQPPARQAKRPRAAGPQATAQPR